jgi:putative glycosyltransferase (TIGR04348 family)
MSHSSVVIVSPALADANNGNWQTAFRWQQMLSARGDVRITRDWPDLQSRGDMVMLALHARRSAAAIEAWHQARGSHALAVVLTGTDLYQDIAVDPQAQRSLQHAGQLVVLQELGVAALPPPLRGRARVIFQSTASQPALPKPQDRLHAVMVGHLRQVKRPQTLFEAARLLANEPGITITHIGDALEPALGELALATEQECPNYRWLGALPHDQTREQIRQAHLLIHASEMEGGAHVVMEAMCSGTPVLASQIPGNVGMLGADYAGYFPLGDASELAALLRQCRDQQRPPVAGDPHGLLAQLRVQCDLRAPLFAPAAERAALLQLVGELEAGNRR